MSNEFPIIEVPEDAIQESEDMGTKPKFWFDHPELGQCLYKQARSNTGEDWSEKIAAELSQLIQLPHADYELATWKQTVGTISPSFVPRNSNLILGNDILVKRNLNYPKSEVYNVSQHTLELVLEVISQSSVKPPLSLSLSPMIQTAVETFLGYLLLDAWIGNTDRHHENWGFIQSPILPDSLQFTIHLAPTFDHASSLGRELQDSNRRKKLENNSINNYITKCRSGFYHQAGDKKAMFTLEAFKIVAQRYPQAASVWLEKLSLISSDETNQLFNQIPKSRISDIAVEFANNVLNLNQQRLLKVRELVN
jgi:hypothetical protein